MDLDNRVAQPWRFGGLFAVAIIALLAFFGIAAPEVGLLEIALAVVLFAVIVLALR